MSTTAIVLESSGAALDRQFESIFREHYQFVYRAAYSVTGSRQDAEDVLQTVFLKLLRHQSLSGFERNPKAYLYRAAINQALNVIRTRRHHQHSHRIDHLPAPPPNDGEAAAGAVQKALLRSIGQLHPRAVEMLVLHYEHDLSDAEIAKMLGKSRGTVAVTLNRARARLRKLMGASGDET